MSSKSGSVASIGVPRKTRKSINDYPGAMPLVSTMIGHNGEKPFFDISLDGGPGSPASALRKMAKNGDLGLLSGIFRSRRFEYLESSGRSGVVRVTKMVS